MTWPQITRRLLAVFGVVIIVYALEYGPALMKADARWSVRKERCPVRHDIFEMMVADRLKRGLETIHHEILDELAKNDFETIERFFNCFSVQEEKPSPDERENGVVRSLVAWIPVNNNYLSFKKTSPFVFFVPWAYAIVLCDQKSDGTNWCHGKYYTEFF